MNGTRAVEHVMVTSIKYLHSALFAEKSRTSYWKMPVLWMFPVTMGRILNNADLHQMRETTYRSHTRKT